MKLDYGANAYAPSIVACCESSVRRVAIFFLHVMKLEFFCCDASYIYAPPRNIHCPLLEHTHIFASTHSTAIIFNYLLKMQCAAASHNVIIFVPFYILHFLLCGAAMHLCSILLQRKRCLHACIYTRRHTVCSHSIE